MGQPNSTGAASSPTAARQASQFDRALFASFLVSLTLFSFIAGAFVAEFEFPWYAAVLKPPFEGLRALQEQHQTDWKLQGHGVARSQQQGIGVHRPEKTYAGLTLYTSYGDAAGAKLVSMSGEVVHSWQMPFREAWPEAQHVANPVPEEQIYWPRVRAFPNGDLLAVYNGLGDTPSGYGLVKLDRDSQIVWKYPGRVHHDLDLDAAGNIYTLAHHIRQEPVKAAPQLKTPILEDFIVVLTPEGEELQRVNVFAAFEKTKFRHILQSIKSNRRGDHTHTNSVQLISPAFAAKHEFCEPGDVLISLRNPSTLAIVNLAREEVVWAAKGLWAQQHDPDPLENGNVLLFDNVGKLTGGGRTRILEWNPTTGGIVWSYGGKVDQRFESDTRGNQQLLPNGNVLITESNNGRLFEVTRDREVVWEFYNSHRAGEDGRFVAAVNSGTRYTLQQLPFLTAEQVAQAGLSDGDEAAAHTTTTIRQ